MSKRHEARVAPPPAVLYVFKLALTLTVLTVCPSLALLSGQTRPNPTQETSYKYDTPGIQLLGTLIGRTVYGPPGYGETPARDVKETILILKLQHDITVEPTADAEAKGSPNLDPVRNIHELQLFVERGQQVNARKLIGRKVSATGTLNESMTASQRTKVWMGVTTLAPK